MLKIAHDIIYKHPLDKNHRFPMEKYDLIPFQLIKENTCNPKNFFIPKNLKDQDVLNTHEKNYYERLSSLCLTKKEIRALTKEDDRVKEIIKLQNKNKDGKDKP